MKYWIVYVLVFISTLQYGWAQQPPADKKKNKDFFNIKAPAIEYTAPDAGEIMFEEEYSDSPDSDDTVSFEPRKELNLVSEDTSSAEEGELSIVEVSEQLRMDSVWVTIAEYFSIWDSRTINPYKIDGAKFSDTINIVLYDSLSGFGWSMPLMGCNKSSEFGMRHSRWHYGTDLTLNIGDPVLAAFDGIVRIAHYDAGGYGNYVLVRHYNGLETLYGHLSDTHVEIGQLVKAGQPLGLGGNTGRSTGPHLHFEVRYEGNAVDSEEIFNYEGNSLHSKNFTLTPSSFEYLKIARQVFYHKVRSGESLGTISRKYRVSITTLCRLNGITTRTILKVGRKLRIR